YASSQLATLRSTPPGQMECGRPSRWTGCCRTRSALNTSASSNNADGEKMIHKRMSIAIGSPALLALIAPACSSDSKNNSSTTVAGAPADTTATADTTAAGGSSAAAGSGLTISGSQFSAASVTAGTEFTITNNDSTTHTVTDDGGSFDV